MCDKLLTPIKIAWGTKETQTWNTEGIYCFLRISLPGDLVLWGYARHRAHAGPLNESVNQVRKHVCLD